MMIRSTLRAYSFVFLASGVSFVFFERPFLRAVGWAAARAGAAPLSAAGPSLWLGLTGSLMAVIALLALRLGQDPGRGEAWNALLLSKLVSSLLFVRFAAATRNPVFLVAAAVDGGILAHLLILRAAHERSLDALAPRRDAPAYEAWFARALQPETGRSLWVRAARTRTDSGWDSSVWAVFFDPRAGKAPRVLRRPRAQASWEFGEGFCRGGVDGARWDLSWNDPAAPAFDVVPAWLRAAGLGRGYASAVPAARFAVRAELEGEPWSFDGAPGGVGHVWGETLGRGWWWTHAIFDDAGRPAVFEALSAPLAPGLRATSVWLRLEGRTLSSCGAWGLVSNSSRREGDAWSLSARLGELKIEATCLPGDFARLDYPSPRGGALVCRHSARARLTLRVRGRCVEKTLNSTAAAVEYAERA